MRHMHIYIDTVFMKIFPKSKMQINNSVDVTNNFIYEDDQSVVLEEKLNPQGQLHLLVVPKKNISVLSNAPIDDKKLLGRLILVANKIATQKGFKGNSYQIMIKEDPKSGKVKSIYIIDEVSKPILWPITPNSRL